MRLFATLAVLVVLAGCGGSPEPAPEKPEPKPEPAGPSEELPGPGSKSAAIYAWRAQWVDPVTHPARELPSDVPGKAWSLAGEEYTRKNGRDRWALEYGFTEGSPDVLKIGAIEYPSRDDARAAYAETWASFGAKEPPPAPETGFARTLERASSTPGVVAKEVTGVRAIVVDRYLLVFSRPVEQVPEATWRAFIEAVLPGKLPPK